MSTNISNNYTTGGNKYPVTRQATFYYLQNYSKSIMRASTDPEGSLLAHRGMGVDGISKDTFEKKYWIDIKCENSLRRGNMSYIEREKL